jgi:hypothetical protein
MLILGVALSLAPPIKALCKLMASHVQHMRDKVERTSCPQALGDEGVGVAGPPDDTDDMGAGPPLKAFHLEK